MDHTDAAGRRARAGAGGARVAGRRPVPGAQPDPPRVQRLFPVTDRLCGAGRLPRRHRPSVRPHARTADHRRADRQRIAHADDVRRRSILAGVSVHSAAVDHAAVRRGAQQRHAGNAHDGPAARLASGAEQVPGVPGVLRRVMAADADLSAGPARGAGRRSGTICGPGRASRWSPDSAAYLSAW